MIAPAPMIPVSVTAAELRALAGLHDQFADTHNACEMFVHAQDGRDRAALLRRLANEVGPAAEDADGLLGVEA